MHSGVFRSTFAKRRAILKRREFSLGKGEVVSSILTGSTRHAAICALFVLALFVIAQTEATHEHGKNSGTLFGGHSRLSDNRSLMFACLLSKADK